MEINLLFGSGISIPTHVCTVEEITDTLLNGNWVKQYNKYIEAGDEYRVEPETDSIQEFLKYIQTRYSTDNHTLNYEEIFYVVTSLKNYDLFPNENFIQKNEYEHIKNHFNLFLKPHKFFDFFMVLNNVFEFFQSAISYLLIQHDEIKGLNILDEIFEDKDISICNIFSLNHDLILEEYFEKKNFKYNSGFNEKDGDVYLFNYESLKSNEADFKIIKLHGSINWYSYSQKPGPYKQTRYGITKQNLMELKNRQGKRYEPLFNYPHFLSGTKNKIIDYSNSTFFELRNFFFQCLQNNSDLIVSGYGWRDKGINKVVYSWLNKTTENKIHQFYENLLEETDFRDFEFYDSRNQIVDYGDYLESSKWIELKKNISFQDSAT